MHEPEDQGAEERRERAGRPEQPPAPDDLEQRSRPPAAAGRSAACGSSLRARRDASRTRASRFATAPGRARDRDASPGGRSCARPARRAATAPRSPCRRAGRRTSRCPRRSGSAWRTAGIRRGLTSSEGCVITWSIAWRTSRRPSASGEAKPSWTTRQTSREIAAIPRLTTGRRSSSSRRSGRRGGILRPRAQAFRPALRCLSALRAPGE